MLPSHWQIIDFQQFDKIAGANRTALHRTTRPPFTLQRQACSCQRTVKFIYSKASNHTITEHWGAHVTLRAVEINATLLTRPTTRAPSRSHTLAANHHTRTRLISIRRRYPRHAWAHVYIGIGTAPWAAIGKDASQGTGARMMLTAQTQTRDRQLRTLAQQRRVRFTNTHTDAHPAPSDGLAVRPPAKRHVKRIHT